MAPLNIGLILLGAVALAVGFGLVLRRQVPAWARVLGVVVGLALLGAGALLGASPATAPPGSPAVGTVLPHATQAAATTLPVAPATTTPIRAPVPLPEAQPMASVPDIRGLTPAAAAELLAAGGLRLGAAAPDCGAMGLDPLPAAAPGTVACQDITPGGMAPEGTTLNYALAR